MHPGHVVECRDDQGDQADANQAEQRGKQRSTDIREEVREGETGGGHHSRNQGRERGRLGDHAGHIHLELGEQRPEDSPEADDDHVEPDEGKEGVRAELAQADPRDGDAQADQQEHPQVRVPHGGLIGDDGGGRESERQNAPQYQVEHTTRHGVDAVTLEDSGINHYCSPQIGTRRECRPETTIRHCK